MKWRVAFATAVLCVAALTGCAQESSEYPAETASALQAQVLLVSESAAAADPATALVRLAELEAGAKDALARETITPERYESIIAAIALVRVDLETAVALIEQQQLEEQQRQEEENKDGDKGNDDEDKPGKGNDDD